jgi:hypothetical protein
MEAIAYKAPALLTTTSPEPPAMLSPSPRPISSYLGAVLNTNGGGHSSLHSMSPTVAAPTSLSVVKDLPLRIRHRARPRRRTGRRHRPRAPSPLDEVLSSPPIPTLGGGLLLCTLNTQQMVRGCYWPRRRHLFSGSFLHSFLVPEIAACPRPNPLTFWSLHRRHGLRLYLSIPRVASLACPNEGHCVGAVVKRSLGYVGKNVWCTTRF